MFLKFKSFGILYHIDWYSGETSAFQTTVTIHQLTKYNTQHISVHSKCCLFTVSSSVSVLLQASSCVYTHWFTHFLLHQYCNVAQMSEYFRTTRWSYACDSELYKDKQNIRSLTAIPEYLKPDHVKGNKSARQEYKFVEVNMQNLTMNHSRTFSVITQNWKTDRDRRTFLWAQRLKLWKIWLCRCTKLQKSSQEYCLLGYDAV